MKTRKLFFGILSALVLVFWLGCDQEHEMPKFTSDFVSFEKANYSLNVMANTEVKIPVYHKNPTKKSSKVSVVITPSENTPSDVFSVGTTAFSFSESDTVYVTVNIDFTKMLDCVTYSLDLEINEADGYTAVSPYDGVEKANLSFVKFQPLVKDEFVGTWSVQDESDYDGTLKYEITIANGDGNTMIVSNLWNSPIDVVVELNDTNPNGFVFRIPDQNYFTHATYGQVKITDLGVGTISVCDMQIKTSYKVYVPAGNFDYVPKSVWTKIVK